MFVAVGTQSKIKLKAVQTAFRLCVKGYSFDSIVSEQPSGIEETLKGARFRAHQAQWMNNGKCRYAVGIENGMVLTSEWNTLCAKHGYQCIEGSEWVDVAAIVVLPKHDDDGWVTWSDPLAIPGECVIESGEVWSELKDPHVVYDPESRPRSLFLSDALTRALDDVEYRVKLV